MSRIRFVRGSGNSVISGSSLRAKGGLPVPRLVRQSPTLQAASLERCVRIHFWVALQLLPKEGISLPEDDESPPHFAAKALRRSRAFPVHCDFDSCSLALVNDSG